MRFAERREIGGDPAAVWARVSDLGAIPTYWHGTREFRVRQEGDKTVADVIFAFGGKGRAEVTMDEKGRTLTIEYVGGPIRGRQTVVVTDQDVEAEWNVDFRGAFRVLGPWNASHFRSGTRHALERLAGVPVTSPSP